MSQPIKTARIFTYSAGAVLAMLSLAILVSNTATADLSLPRDPLLQIPMRLLLWIVGGVAAVLAVHCLFGQNARWQLAAVAWLSLNFWVYRLFLLYGGFPRFRGFTGNLPGVLRISPGAADFLTAILFGFLLIGSVSLFGYVCFRDWQHARAGYLKMFCPSCGGRVEFLPVNLGQTNPCPHCQARVTLRKPDVKLKMSCFFCEGHIEFPIHAIGEKLQCPHCQKDITLKEPAIG